MMSNYKTVQLVLNIEDPEQKELYEWLTKLPSGKKRNQSSFLKTISDRAYQEKKEEYLAEKRKYSNKKTIIKSLNGEIKFSL
jgi:hypothetical protein